MKGRFSARFPTWVLALHGALLVACGGGGGGAGVGSPPPAPVNVAFSYPSPSYGFSAGITSVSITPAITSGTATQWTSSPALPAGLTLNASTGVISGTPSATAARTTYRITGSNGNGSGFADVSLAVGAGVLLDVGHAMHITHVVMNASRAMTLDQQGRAILWDKHTGTKIHVQEGVCSSYTNCGRDVGLHGPIAVARTLDGFIVRSSTDGSLLSNISFPRAGTTWWRVAPDGSYLCGGNSTSLTVWSPNGTLLASLAGNYADAVAFAAENEVRVGGGPAGAQVIQKIAVPGGSATLTPNFLGTIDSWFLDGDRFLTRVGSTIRVYSAGAVLEDIASPPTLDRLAGRDNWFWSADSHYLRIYAVGSSASPVVQFPLTFGLDFYPASGAVLAMVNNGTAQIGIVDLSLAMPALTQYALPVPDVTAFDAVDESDWIFGNRVGAVLGELSGNTLPQRYSLGMVTAVAASAGRLAVATSDGSLQHYDAATLAHLGTLNFAASRLTFSQDGGILHAEAPALPEHFPDRATRFYAMPAGALIHERPHGTYLDPQVVTSMLSASGTTVGEVLSEGHGHYRYVVTELAGTPVMDFAFTNINSNVRLGLRLSPGGSHSAMSFGHEGPNMTTDIRQGPVLVGATQGEVVGWIDDERILLNRYAWTGSATYAGVDVVGPSGVVLSSLSAQAMPEMRWFQSLEPGSIYTDLHNLILNPLTGGVRWASGSSGVWGLAASGTHVFVGIGTTIRAEPR